VAVVVLSLASACTIDTPELGDGGAGIPQECSPYADLLVTYTPPDASQRSPEEGERALGAPDGEGVVLEVDAVLTVGFVGAGGVEDGEDADLIVHATGDPGSEVTVYAAEAEGDFAFVGLLTPNEREIDLSTARIRRALYLRFVGTAGTMTLDAIEATRDICGELTAHRVGSPHPAASDR
jgi:hypothetical protein